METYPKAHAMLTSAASPASAATASAASALESKNVVQEIKHSVETYEKNTAGRVKLLLDPRNGGVHPSNRANVDAESTRATGYVETELPSPMGFEKALEGELHDEHCGAEVQ